MSVWLLLMAFFFPISIAASSLTFFPLIGLYLLAGVWTFRRWPPSWGRLETLFAIFWGLSILSALQGGDPWHSRISLEKDLYFALVILLAALLRERREETSRLLRAMVWGGLVTAAFGLLQAALRVNHYDIWGQNVLIIPPALASWPRVLTHHLALSTGRSTGFRSHPLTFAETLLFPLAYMLSLLTIPTPRSAWKWIGAASVLILALMLSQSRGPWIAFAVMALTLLILEPRPWVIRRLGFLVLFPIALMIGIPGMRHRAASIGDTGFLSNAERLIMWKAGSRMVHDHPAWGVGPGNVALVSARYQTPEQHAMFGDWGHLHNTYVHIAAERGLLGLAALLSFLGYLGWTLGKALRKTTAEQINERVVLLTALLGLVGWMVSGLTEAVYTDSSVLMVFYLVMGLALVKAQEPKDYPFVYSPMG